MSHHFSFYHLNFKGSRQNLSAAKVGILQSKLFSSRLTKPGLSLKKEKEQNISQVTFSGKISAKNDKDGKSGTFSSQNSKREKEGRNKDKTQGRQKEKTKEWYKKETTDGKIKIWCLKCEPHYLLGDKNAFNAHYDRKHDPAAKKNGVELP